MSSTELQSLFWIIWKTIKFKVNLLPLEYRRDLKDIVLIFKAKAGHVDLGHQDFFWPTKYTITCTMHANLTSCILLWKWINQHVTSVEQRKNVQIPQQDSNLWPPKHWAGTLSIWATENSWRARPHTSILVTRWLIHFHICFTELKIYHLSFFHHTVWHWYCWSLQYAGCTSNMNLASIWPHFPWVLSSSSG